MRDVIVIGAGPAGCSAAKALADSGRSVLLVEKFSLPRYKSCSGVLIRKSMELCERYFGEGVPEEALCEPALNRGMIFTDDMGREYRFEQEGRNVWRAEFDNWLARKAVSAGVCLCDKTSVISVGELSDCVEVTLRGEETYTERARYVIDCEGVVGAVKRGLLGSREEYITTFQTFSSGTIDLDPHYFYAYLQPGLSEYDAWFNVKDNMLVLGVAVRDARGVRKSHRAASRLHGAAMALCRQYRRDVFRDERKRSVLRQYCTRIVVRSRQQFFRQIAKNRRIRLTPTRRFFGKNAEKIASKRAAKPAGRSLCGVAQDF